MIVPVFGSSITRLANAATIESAFDAVASRFDADFSNPVTVNIGVGWGVVGTKALEAGAVSGSSDNLSGPYSYASVVNSLVANLPYNPGDQSLATAVANLPATDPTHLNAFEIPYAEGKALGLIAANRASIDGYIGFKTSGVYDFDPADGIALGAYDFQALAGHEMEEVLGRMSGQNAAAPTWATLFDLYRYSAPGVSSFSHTAAAYFSIDGGKTDLGNFNYSGTGDRGDLLTLSNSTDIQSAYFQTGKAYAISANDLTALDVLGWGSWSGKASGLVSTTPSIFSPVGSAMSGVPEPSTWCSLILGFMVLGACLRRKRAFPRARAA